MKLSDLLESKRNLHKDFLRKSLIQLKRVLNSSKLEESDEIEKPKNLPSAKVLSIKEKKDILKGIYKQMLTRDGRLSDLKVFERLIDNSPEDYLDYELKINHELASKMITDFRHGKNPLTKEQVAVFADLFQNIGKPALEEYSTGKHKMDSRVASFGAEGLNRGAKEYFDNAERQDRVAIRNNKTDIETRNKVGTRNTDITSRSRESDIRKTIGDMFSIKVDAKTQEILRGLSGSSKPSRNIEKEILDIMVSSGTKSEAIKKAKENPKLSHINVSNSEFNDLWNNIKRQKEKVRN